MPPGSKRPSGKKVYQGGLGPLSLSGLGSEDIKRRDTKSCFLDRRIPV